MSYFRPPKIGDKVRMVEGSRYWGHQPPPPNDVGEVVWVSGGSILVYVEWDSGRRLCYLWGSDVAPIDKRRYTFTVRRKEVKGGLEDRR